MNWKPTAGAFLLTMGVAFGAGAYAADDPHRHDGQVAGSSKAEPSTPAVQPSAPESVPLLGSAEDMLKAMESMPAHDHDSCCALAKPKPKPDGHNH